MKSCAIHHELLELYSKEELSLLDFGRVPHHIAIIPDGNRRWAKRFLFAPEKGHAEGAETLTRIVNAARLLGVKVLTVYTFSTENWQRPKLEIMMLMKLLKNYLKTQKPGMVRDGIRLQSIGDLTPFSNDILETLHETKEATASGKNIDLVLALNYGSRDEIKRAIHSIIDDYSQSKIEKKNLTQETIAAYLDTGKWKDPDLLIRTSGELRISNFLLWQLSYAEIYSTPVLWPDFTPRHFLEAVLSFQKRERRLGVGE